jgi:hypothetical protein
MTPEIQRSNLRSETKGRQSEAGSKKKRVTINEEKNIT